MTDQPTTPWLSAHPSPARVAELAHLYPLGAYLTVWAPLPATGVISEHTATGLFMTRPGMSGYSFVSWYGLNTAKVDRVPGGAE